jgi:hypothetical protein
MKMHIQNYPLNLPTSTVTLFSDTSVQLTAPGGVGITAGSVFVVGLFGIKYNQNYFTYASVPNNENFTTPVVGLEVWNVQQKSQITVASVPQMTILLRANTVQSPGSCRYLNTQSSTWANDGVNITAVSVGTSISCSSTHLTEFAGFVAPGGNSPAPPPAPGLDPNLYLLFLLLLIPAFAVGLGIVIIVAIAIMKAQKPSTVLRTDYNVQLEQIGI